MPRSHRRRRSTGPPSARRPRSYTPLADALRQPLTFADTELAEGLRRHGLPGLLAAALGRARRPGAEPLANLLCALLVWPLLQAQSLHCFCAELCQILQGKVSVLYDFLGREDVNWRGLLGQLAGRVYRANEVGPRSQRAFVVDDTSQARAGRKVEGTSCYFDHTEGRTRHGHQVLHLGLAGERGFLPLEAQIVMGEKRRVEKPQAKPFKDQRSAAARDLRRAGEHSKHALFREMLQRALRAGFNAALVLADAWFGCKETIACCLEQRLTAIFQMKRGLLLYQYQGRDYTAHQLYAQVRRRLRPRHRRARFKTASLIVSLNLQTEPRRPAHWVKVRLVFSAPVRAASADTWVVFLCTDPDLGETQVLQAYALRWSIEVYFKEVKQNLGFLKEQSGRYQVAYASVHLAAVRYLLLFEAMLRQGRLSYGEIRDRETGRLQVLTYAALLWQLFRSLIEGALDGLVRELGPKVINKVLAAIDQGVESFLEEALQIKAPQVAVQLEAEALGYL